MEGCRSECAERARAGEVVDAVEIMLPYLTEADMQRILRSVLQLGLLFLHWPRSIKHGHWRSAVASSLFALLVCRYSPPISLHSQARGTSRAASFHHITTASLFCHHPSQTLHHVPHRHQTLHLVEVRSYPYPCPAAAVVASA